VGREAAAACLVERASERASVHARAQRQNRRVARRRRRRNEGGRTQPHTVADEDKTRVRNIPK